MALQSRAPATEAPYGLQQRRLDLYKMAAPVFRTFGYRQVTMKALAHACGVSAPALYRYFPSKLDFATFPLAPAPQGFCVYLLAGAARSEADRLRGLRAMLESAALHVDLVALGVDLAIQARHDQAPTYLYETVRDLEGPATQILLECVPELGDRAAELIHTIVSLIVAAGATQTLPSAEELMRHTVPITRAYLVDGGIVDRVRFDEVFGAAS